MMVSLAEFCCFGCNCLQLLWPRVVLRKLLNIPSGDSDFGADSEIDDFDDTRTAFGEDEEDPNNDDNNNNINQGGSLPPNDLDIEEWLNIDDPSDIYVIGLQEIVPLNAGNIFGAEDNRPALKWESLIRETLSRVPPVRNSYKSYSDPPSPSKFKPSDDVLDFEDEMLLETDSDNDEVVHPIDEEPGCCYEVRDKTVGSDTISRDNIISDGGEVLQLDTYGHKGMRKQFSSPKIFDEKQFFQSSRQDDEDVPLLKSSGTKLKKTLSGTEKIGLSWPEPPLNLIAQRVLDRPCSFQSTRSFTSSKSFRRYNSFKIFGDRRTVSDATALTELDLESLIQWRRKKPEYVRIVSKQMVGIFLTIWVRKSLRKHIQNLKVSTVGVGVMGYIGNKGAVSVSMSIYQTLFCFICTHLTSGEKELDQLKRNADVHEIRRRTIFRSGSGLGAPKNIQDHEKIIWLGDLNYRINLSYDETRRLISRKEWSKLLEKDQLVRELRKGHVFAGWCEGVLRFPPTYKYAVDSDNYVGEDPSKAGRRTPAWCDRVLSFGKGIKLMSYRRSELKLSDHRPVTAIYDIEVEVFSSKKLQKALTFTNAEIENDDILVDKRMDAALSNFRIEEVSNGAKEPPLFCGFMI
ncbi:hypothetical protein KSS87_000373 [Heliosperma pusillum]|nr:hypothetical protein KSS87_000373 [Heliosperma pusillum]